MRQQFEQSLCSFVERMGAKSVLRDACEYALMSGGKRLRPLLVLMIADSLKGYDVMHAAISVECFHTSSLIADDLPCMDDDSMRRGKPSLHKAFGESTALLASYTLMSAGYGGIYENAKRMKIYPEFKDQADSRAILCLEAATRCAGIQGATQGQFLDLFPPSASLETIQEIIYKKTVTLFEICFLFGWLFGGGDIESIPYLKKCAYHLGMAFQMADDLEDETQDAPASSLNIAKVLGKKEAISLAKKEIASLRDELMHLNLWTRPFQKVHQHLIEKISLSQPLLSHFSL